MHKLVTCIIPCYNEAPRIRKVLERVIKIEGIDQIICVDDGSTDETSTEIKSIANIELVRLDNNTGKADAIAAGLNLANGDYILLIDGDLIDLKPEEFEQAIKLFRLQLYPIDLIILKPINEPAILHVLRSNVLCAGQRILSRNDLKEVFKRNPHGYQLESVTNQYMIDHKKKVYWLPSSATTILKSEKIGFMKGILQDIRGQSRIPFGPGLFNYLLQVLNFAHQKAPLNYSPNQL